MNKSLSGSRIYELLSMPGKPIKLPVNYKSIEYLGYEIRQYIPKFVRGSFGIYKRGNPIASRDTLKDAKLYVEIEASRKWKRLKVKIRNGTKRTKESR